MRAFKAIEWFHIKGRGDVVSVANDQEFERDTGHLIGETVIVDGKPYIVEGVESFAVTPVRQGSPIGLLVRPAEQQSVGREKP